jgi:(1->4)-alpha-D-glucan 1-alpha-D-glucosylmutase
MLLGRDDPMAPEDEADRIRFVMRFQQLTGPVMAKGLEDTVFYRYFRLTALNEVGGDPAHFGATLEEFHRHNQEQLSRWPDALLSSSTHDTKRSEDVRARIVTISEFSREWRASVNRWSRLNGKHRSREGGESAPTRNYEALFYQTLVGTWPFGVDRPDADYVERIVAYMLKAAREAQEHTSWVNPDEVYEGALERFVRRTLDPSMSAAFLDDFAAANREIERAGALTSLAMQVLKLTSPGVPDLYQGTECWDLSLVDPDNRRPVDYDARRAMLDELTDCWDQAARISNLTAQLDNGAIKLYTTMRLLRLRREQPELFTRGEYVPIEAEGELRDQVIAYARRLKGQTGLVVVPRLLRSLVRKGSGLPVGEAVWGNTQLVLSGLAGERLVNRLTGEAVTVAADGRLPVASVLNQFPVACLERDRTESFGGNQ